MQLTKKKKLNSYSAKRILAIQKYVARYNKYIDKRSRLIQEANDINFMYLYPLSARQVLGDRYV